MTWPGFLTASGAWLFLLFVPLVVFYFLKLKRPRLEIPSLALWRSVLNDRRVNAPFQKFKRNILLLLQALLLAALCLAAMQPFWPSGADRARYLPILIDTSASMAALDERGGRTRLEAAQAEVETLIDNLLPDQRLSLIEVSSTARRLTDFTDNKRVLREALSQMEISPVASRLEDALRMTQALARTVPVETVVLFTDGNVPADIDFELPFQLQYQKLPPPGQNIGITALNARRTADHWDVFVRVDGSKEAQAAATVELLQNGQPADSELISLEPGQSQRIVFQVDAGGPQSVEVRLRPEGFDSLELDNVAYMDLPVGRPLTVYCAPGLVSYRHALVGLKGVVLHPDKEGQSDADSFDLVISDQPADKERDAPVAVFTGFVPDDIAPLVKLDEESADVIDWQRSNPLLQHVLLTDLQIADRPVSAEGVRDRDFEEAGYEILAQSRTGPLILRRDAGGRPQFYILFHTDRSTLPYRVGFPILVGNAVEIAQSQAGLTESRGQATGMLAPRALKPETTYRVTGPDGATIESLTGPEGLLTGVPAPAIGRYTIEEEGREVASAGVSLLTGSESSLASVDRLQFKELAVGAAASMLKSDRPLWPLFAVGGFALLLVEWWFFQRRPSGMPGP